MSEVTVKLNRTFIVVYCFVSITAMLLPAWLLTWSVVSRYLVGQSLHYVDSWITLIIADAVALLGCAFMLWIIIALSSTRFTEEGIWQRKFVRWNFIAWNDITSVEADLWGVRLAKRRQKIGVFALLYSNWDEITDFIRPRTPSHLNRK